MNMTKLDEKAFSISCHYDHAVGILYCLNQLAKDFDHLILNGAKGVVGYGLPVLESIASEMKKLEENSNIDASTLHHCQQIIAMFSDRLSYCVCNIEIIDFEQNEAYRYFADALYGADELLITVVKDLKEVLEHPVEPKAA